MMHKYKKYSQFILFTLVVFLLFHFFTWSTYTKYVFPKEYNIGDLGRMSYLIESLSPRIEFHTLPVANALGVNNKIEKIDIVTAGDSFSKGGGTGKNNYYQEYISFYNNKTVLNIKDDIQPINLIEKVLILNSSGMLDKWKTNYVIIESVERSSINRFAKNINFNTTVIYDNQTFTKSKLYFPLSKSLLQKSNKDLQVREKKIFDFYNYDLGIINNLNINAIKYNLSYLKYNHPYSSSVYKVKLEKSFFTSNDDKSLLFYKDDLPGIALSTRENINLLNDNFNKLARILKKKNIKLYFMPAVDKYNLYSKYIVDNSYPKSQFFELLRELPKEYEFIDTKKILREELEKGVKDLYYSDDTHWSYKASEAIFKKVKFE